MKCPRCNAEINLKELKYRSTPENNYYFGVVIDILSNELGYTKMELHELLKSMFLRQTKYLKTKDGVREVSVIKSTTSLSVGEFEDYLSAIRQFASISLGIYLPLPNEGESIDQRVNQ